MTIISGENPTLASRQALQRQTIVVVMASQVFGGAGLAAGVTVGALLAEDMLDTTSLSGLPAALFTFGSAAAALSVGRMSLLWTRVRNMAWCRPVSVT